MNLKILNTVIVGGGHAGCNLGCWLRKTDPHRSYVILERADSLLPKWKHDRWEGFQLNTPVRFSQLYGEKDESTTTTSDDYTLDRPLAADIQRWESHIEAMKLHYALRTNVDSVTQNQDGDFVTKATNTATGETSTYVSKNLLCCNGCFDRPKITKDPVLTRAWPHIRQLTPAGLQWSDLQPGGVLIVGGGQSGVQIANLLAEQKTTTTNHHHRPLALCSSPIKGTPRSFRGKDIFYWMETSGLIVMPKQALESMPPEKAQSMRYSRNAIVGATESISLFSLHRQGVEILGGLERVVSEEEEDHDDDGPRVLLKPNRATNVQQTVEGYENLIAECQKIADKLEAQQQEGQATTFEPYVPDPAWEPVEELLTQNGPESLNLQERGITNVIWAVGHTADFSWLQIPAAKKEFDAPTQLPDDLCSRAAPGLFFTGFPWVGHIQSINLFNFNLDHAIIMSKLRAD